MTPDTAYALTRRRGKLGTVNRLTGESANNPETGQVVHVVTQTQVRWMVKEPTRYSRLVRATATKQDIGQTTFIMWTEDLDFTKLDPDDFITFAGLDYQVRTAAIEDDTSFVVTADEVV